MANSAIDVRQQAHELIDSLGSGQVLAVVGLLKVMIDPLARTLANAPCDDEPVSEAEKAEIAAARVSFARGEGISHEEVLGDFGLSMEDWERMGRTPLEALTPRS
jgi:hypothetical protein